MSVFFYGNCLCTIKTLEKSPTSTRGHIVDTGELKSQLR